jgi:asparagine synthase (glutamine-hydrolysing)
MAEHDETLQAKAFIAENLPGTPHFIHLADAQLSEAELMELAKTHEEPVATPSILAGHRIFRAIRDDGFKVVLSGEGADELFGGYTSRYMNQLTRERLLGGEIRPALRMLRNGAAKPRQVANRLLWDLPPQVVRGLLRQLRHL